MNDDFKNYIQLLIDNKDKITHLPERDIHNLLDYITNLQQRIKYLERSNNRREDTIMGLRDEIVEYEDYKSRIEKAVEYIKQSINESQLIFGWNDIQRYHNNEMKELIDILNGRSDE